MAETKKTKKMITPTMLLITSNWGPTPTFKLVPTEIDCPYIEAIYNPAASVLAVIGTRKKDVFHMVERLDENGDPKKRKGVVNKEEPNQKQRIAIESYSEYYITEFDEISSFVENFAVNAKDYDWKKHTEMKSMDNANGMPSAIHPAAPELLSKV